MRDDRDQLVLAARLDQQVGGAADLERRERRERRVDGHTAGPRRASSWAVHAWSAVAVIA